MKITPRQLDLIVRLIHELRSEWASRAAIENAVIDAANDKTLAEIISWLPAATHPRNRTPLAMRWTDTNQAPDAGITPQPPTRTQNKHDHETKEDREWNKLTEAEKQARITERRIRLHTQLAGSEAQWQANARRWRAQGLGAASSVFYKPPTPPANTPPDHNTPPDAQNRPQEPRTDPTPNPTTPPA